MKSRGIDKVAKCWHCDGVLSLRETLTGELIIVCRTCEVQWALDDLARDERERRDRIASER